MSNEQDLSQGVAVGDLADGDMLSGQVQGEPVIMVRSGESLFAVGAQCTHYHGELAQGLVVDGTVRCPLHHACFDLRTGEALRAPALDAIACWRVERVGDTAFVRERLPAVAKPASTAGAPQAVVIVGGGAAGLACADQLRREGYRGKLTMLSADASAPVDRPNVSKDYLAGTAPEDWMPLRSDDYYREQSIDLRLNTKVTAIDLVARQVKFGDGLALPFDALLLATGADPVRLDIPGAKAAQVRTLRSLGDSRAIIAAAPRRVVVLGASFIGLEVAASLRERGIEVHVVAPDKVPMQKVLGEELGRFVQGLHEAHGVHFHLGATVAKMDGTQVTLSNGTTLEADLVVQGLGVRPALALAEQAGLAMDRGVRVDAFLQTSVAGVFAAGDIARWPDPYSGECIRVEHWVVAQRQGQVAALNMLGRRQAFDAVPFFWSQHYDVAIHYVGHAEGWDTAVIDGSLAQRSASVTYGRGARTLAVASVGRDLQGLKEERRMELARG
jgi:NADPH-dependent 2,4-dienoyl-CoA reductase/sulfur reductase-like enzyme/nitrite reductase/ring-hydroxylating ferredoxin subunit